MTPHAHDVLCVGILVADLFASPMERLPVEGELLVVDELSLQAGGCAANTAVDLAKLGVRAAVVGRVGDDVFAGFVRQWLTARGVDASGISTSSKLPTSRTVILPVKGQDRRYVHSIGATAELAEQHVDLGMIAAARALYVGGYGILPRLDQSALVRLFGFARDHGVRTVLDVAGVRPDEGMAPLERLLPLTDVFLPNDDEARLITGESDPARQAQRFLNAGAGTVYVTLGAEGALAVTGGECLRAEAYRPQLVDPSGAGDAFDAGIILGLLEGWDLRTSLEFASAVGASAVTRLGCTDGVFTRAQAEAFVAGERLPIFAV
jgi:sugar/nucleoside kinase (ribokinase family)